MVVKERGRNLLKVVHETHHPAILLFSQLSLLPIESFKRGNPDNRILWDVIGMS